MDDKGAPVTIAALELENVKRVKAVALKPEPAGLTVVGGPNGAGKTSVLDAIAWALGGARHRPSEPRRAGSATDPRMRVELSNGVVVTREGKNGALKVIDPSGNRAGQQLLDALIEELALDMPRFLHATPKEKAQTLLQVIGVGDELFGLQAAEQELYDERTAVGRMRDAKRASAEEMAYYPDAPDSPVSAAELIRSQQGILARNGERQRLREQAEVVRAKSLAADAELAALKERLEAVQAEVGKKEAEAASLRDDLAEASKTAAEQADESTAEVEASISAIELTNEKVRSNQARALAADEADALAAQYEQLTARITAARAAQAALLEGADLPLPGLSVIGGELAYNSMRWDNMSGSEQMRVAVAVVRRLNPGCGFVLVDQLERMDAKTLAGFAAWCEAQGLQVIGTRVTADASECTIMIEDGYAAGDAPAREWKDGVF